MPPPPSLAALTCPLTLAAQAKEDRHRCYMAKICMATFFEFFGWGGGAVNAIDSG